MAAPPDVIRSIEKLGDARDTIDPIHELVELLVIIPGRPDNGDTGLRPVYGRVIPHRNLTPIAAAGEDVQNNLVIRIKIWKFCIGDEGAICHEISLQSYGREYIGKKVYRFGVVGFP